MGIAVAGFFYIGAFFVDDSPIFDGHHFSRHFLGAVLSFVPPFREMVQGTAQTGLDCHHHPHCIRYSFAASRVAGNCHFSGDKGRRSRQTMGGTATLRTRCHLRTEYVTGRDVRDTQALGQQNGLCPLSSTWWTQKNELASQEEYLSALGLLDEPFVMAHQELGLQLPHRIYHHTDHNQQTR